MEEVYGYIYMVINIFNHHIYIGQTVQDVGTRWKQHWYNAQCEYNDFLETGKKPCPFYCALWQYGGMDSFIWVTIDKAFSKKRVELKRKILDCIL